MRGKRGREGGGSRLDYGSADRKDERGAAAEAAAAKWAARPAAPTAATVGTGREVAG